MRRFKYSFINKFEKLVNIYIRQYLNKKEINNSDDKEYYLYPNQ